MAANIRNNFSDLRCYSILVFLLVGFIIEGSVPLSSIPASCSKTSGNFDEEGRCQPCYTGDCCTEHAKSKPKFRTLSGDSTSDKVTITKDGLVSDLVVYTAEAEDVDRAEACGEYNVSCPCGDFEFFLKDDLGLFKIDSESGKLSVPDVAKLKRQLYAVTVVARNLDKSSQAEMDLNIYSEVGEANDAYDVRWNENGYDNKDDFSHRRVKRATGPPPSNVTFDLVKKSPHENTVDMKVGQKIEFKLTITFPAEDTNMLVELFTPDNDTIIMMLCGVRVLSVGSNLDITGSREPTLYSIENNLYHDRAVIDFGNVTNTGATGEESINQIVIEYEAVMLDTVTTNGSTYWVSAGAEYNFEADVWVGQASFVCINDSETFSETPTVNLTGPSNMAIGSSAVFTVDMFIPYPAVTLSFDAFAPLNTSDVMSICAVKGKDVAVNYDCGLDITKKVNVLHTEGNVKGNARGHLEIGKVYNKGVRDTGNSESDNRITIEFVAHLYDDPAFQGQKYWVGAAVEIGTDQIWAGQIEVTADPKTTGSASGATIAQPAVTPNGAKTSENKPVTIEGKLTIPQSSTGEYKLEVKGPTGQKIQICSVRIVSAGGHLPCVDKDAEPEYTISTPGGIVVDGAILDLKGISNIGPWASVNSSADADPDIITFQALVKATNFSTPGSENVEFGFYVDGSSIATKTVSVTIENAAALPEIGNETVPQMKMEFKSGTENVKVNGASRVALEITTARDTIYPVMDIEFIMPNDSDADGHSPISICRTEITSTGKNLPCAIKSVVNTGIQYDSKYPNGLYDRSILSMGSLCNSEVVNDTVEDKMILETVVQLHEHTSMTNGTQQWISAGVMFSDKMMWVGQLAVFSITDGPLETQITPHIAVVTNSSDNTPVGYAAVYTLVIKTGANDHAHYSVNVSTADDKLTICNVRVLAVGYNMPCVRDDIKNVLSQDASGRNNKASLDLGVVSNVGTSAINPTEVFDDNTLMIEVVVQLDKSATNAGSHPFDILTTYGTQTNTKTVNVVATTDLSGVNMTVNASSTIAMGILPITSNDDSSVVNKGQGKRVFLDIFVPMGVTQDLTTKVLAPINQASIVEINYIGILDIGENLPCLHRDSTTADYIDRTSTQPSKHAIASLSLGIVCNVGVNKEDNLANRIRVEAVVRVLKNDSINVGDVITLSGSLNTNNELIMITQQNLVVADNFTDILPENMTLVNDTAIKLNMTEDPILMRVNEERTIPIHLIIPPYLTTIVKFDVDLPVNDSAVLTYKSLEVTGSGVNLAGYGTLDNELTITEKSSRNTSQINKVYVDMGIVTNAGSTHRIDKASDAGDDDAIHLELTVVLADSAINTNGSTHWISLGVKIGIYIVILEHKVMVIKDGTEKPCIEFTGEVDNALSTATKVVINGLVKHANESTAESTNMTAFVLFPPFLKFMTLSSINDSLLDCSHTNDGDMMRLTCAWFYFTDTLSFTAVLEQDTNYKVPPSVQGKDAVITLATASTMHGSADDFSCNMNYVNHTVTVTPKAVSNCTTVVIGVNDVAKIADCQISGSPDHYTGEEPLKGRKGGTGFSPFVRKGSLKTKRYFQVYLGNKALVQKIEVDQRAGVGVKVTKIFPYFSNDGYAWMPGSEIDVPSIPSTVDVVGAIEARYVRIYITNDDQDGQKQLGVTFELHGCYTSNDLATGQICNSVVTEEGITNADWHRTGFLNSGGNVYVCDAAIDNDLKQACYKTIDGNSWEKLDERLGCMVGHDSDKNHLYALANDGLTYMSSIDDGKTWASVRKEKFDEVKVQAAFKAPNKMKWEANAALETGTPDALHTDGDWGASYDGLSKKNGASWPVRFNWASCCGK